VKERTCRKCEESWPLKCFVKSKGYRVWTCNACRALTSQKWLECKNNREFNSLVSWPVQ
jgi:hypothetical protein